MQVSLVRISVVLVLFACAGCSEKKQLRQSLVTKPDAHKVAAKAETAHKIEMAKADNSEFKLTDFLNKPVRDKSGKEIARVDDLSMGQNGRIATVALTLKNAQGENKITIPFEAIKTSKDDKGGLVLEALLPLDQQPPKDAKDYKPDGKPKSSNTDEKQPSADAAGKDTKAATADAKKPADSKDTAAAADKKDAKKNTASSTSDLMIVAR